MKGFGKFLVGVLSGGMLAKAPGERVNAHLRRHQEVFDLADAAVGKAIADTNVVAVLGPGEVIDHIRVVADVSLTTAQLQFGTATDPVKYGAAKAYGTTAGVPIDWYAPAAMVADALNAKEEVVMTISAAALPNTGKVITDVFTSAR